MPDIQIVFLKYPVKKGNLFIFLFFIYIYVFYLSQAHLKKKRWNLLIGRFIYYKIILINTNIGHFMSLISKVFINSQLMLNISETFSSNFSYSKLIFLERFCIDLVALCFIRKLGHLSKFPCKGNAVKAKLHFSWMFLQYFV